MFPSDLCEIRRSCDARSVFVRDGNGLRDCAWAIWPLRNREGHFRPERKQIGHHSFGEFRKDLKETFIYMRATPLVFAVGMAYVGWASGGGAAQILFTLFGELVFKRGSAGIGII